MAMTTGRTGFLDAVEHEVFGYAFVTCQLAVELDRKVRARFEEVWAFRPDRFSEIKDHPAADLPIIEPYLAWVRSAFEARSNGPLLNRYNAELSRRAWGRTAMSSPVSTWSGTRSRSTTLASAAASRTTPRQVMIVVNVMSKQPIAIIWRPARKGDSRTKTATTVCDGL